ncbi:PREDICTED: auxin-binding protein ABP19a-like [Fragaria vesca subsp. vesca]|uniref:auxin-binding protein ABP19a-like n=1 Tax=Fragaria vesca subsp. vesca TaxID=101020 RepID=UPI0002C3751A|nr:PREDICTED: auxin-binding protein ABP19a-like [Fragaria vesca subsp. vesca]
MNSPVFFFVASLIVSCSYASHVQDFCVADYAAPKSPVGYACKDPAKVTVDDFIHSGLGVPSNTSNVFKFGFSAAFAFNYSGINGLGVSLGRADVEVGGVVPIHAHPGATELVVVAEGSNIIGGFIASNSKVYQKPLTKGDTMVLPQGLYHFFVNQGNTPAVIYAAFSSESPTVQLMDTSLFKNDLSSDIVAKTTLLDLAQVQKLKKLFGGTN